VVLNMAKSNDTKPTTDNQQAEGTPAPEPAAAPAGGELIPDVTRRHAEALEAENARLRQQLTEANRTVNPNALESNQYREAKPFVPETSKHFVKLGDGRRGNTLVIGEGEHVWRGSIPADRTAPEVTFRSPSASQADAASEYMRHCGMTSTVHPIRMERVDASELTPAPEPAAA
jgi:hypothetical protein